MDSLDSHSDVKRRKFDLTFPNDDIEDAIRYLKSLNDLDKIENPIIFMEEYYREHRKGRTTRIKHDENLRPLVILRGSNWGKTHLAKYIMFYLSCCMKDGDLQRWKKPDEFLLGKEKYHLRGDDICFANIRGGRRSCELSLSHAERGSL
ncbi:uncharacterized protein LOC135845768 [Planococcus citri]|uniref:uncharacterized protein LOC135845768 n=1 Tax=Planococcus citri TaxID=170843 RepID=UPI0031F962CC